MRINWIYAHKFSRSQRPRIPQRGQFRILTATCGRDQLLDVAVYVCAHV
jgi:hypothetical protein